MSAVVRVKRRISDEPLTGFVLNCKKHKNNEIRENLFETKDEMSTLLKFAGTVESQDDDAVNQLNRLTKTQAENLAQKIRKPKNVTEKSRQEMRDNIHENRFKVVNCYRTINNEDIHSKSVTIVDIEKQQNDVKTKENQNSQNSEASSSSQDTVQDLKNNDYRSEETNFVYDLYLPESNELNDNTDDIIENYSINNLSVRPFDDFTYEERYKNDSDEADSEDSNCEDYYKNEYPDSDCDYDSVNEDDIRRAVDRLDIDDDLSTTDEEDHYVNTIDFENGKHKNDIDFCYMADRYGTAYARYRARNIQKNNTFDSNNDYESSDSD